MALHELYYQVAQIYVLNIHAKINQLIAHFFTTVIPYHIFLS